MDTRAATDLLCTCLNLAPKATPDDRVAALTTDDWREVLDRADVHRLTPMLYQYAQTAGIESQVPPGVAQELREIWLRNAIRNTRLYSGLGQLLAALNEANIPVILLKGCHLASLVYDNMAMRAMNDVDMLVHQADLVRTGETLIDLGYTPGRNRWQEAVSAAAHHLPAFTRPDAVAVEVHWLIAKQIGLLKQVGSPLRVDTKGLWERSRATRIADTETRVLSPEDLLLHLCLHSVEHSRAGLKLRGFYDIALTIQHYESEIDWAVAQNRAQMWRAARHVYLSLRLAKECFNAAVPDAILETLIPQGADAQAMAWAREQVFACRQEVGQTSPYIHNLARVKETRGLLTKIRALCATAFPPRAVIARYYPVSADSIWVYAYYARRIWDMLSTYGQSAWRLALGQDEVVSVAKQDSRANALREWLAQ